MSPAPHVTEADVQLLAVLVDLPIDPADRSGVASALAVVLGAAQLVMDFPLPEDVHPLPMFRP